MKPLGGSMMERLRRYFVGGLLVLIPILFTLWIVERLFTFLSGFLVGPVISLLGGHEALLSPLPLLGGLGLRVGHLVPATSVIMLLFVIVATGFVGRNFIGSRLVGVGEQLVGQIPIIRRIYTAVRQISHALLSDRQQAFRRVVMFEYPRRGIWSVGFVTADSEVDREHGDMGEPHYHVFLPTTPNPTSGFLLIVPKDQCVELDMSVQEALKLVISGGAVMPEGSGRGEQTGRLPPPPVMDADGFLAHPPSTDASSDASTTSGD